MDSDNILSILAALGQAPMAPQPVPEQGITPVSYQPLPDAAPISNVLQAIGQQAPPAQSDIMSQIANMAPPPAPIDAPMPPQAPVTPTPQAPAPTAAPAAPGPAEPPRKRRSVIETIGRLADVFAKVGGAEALYEPTLNARENRGFAQEDRARQIDMDALKLAAGKFELGNAQNARLGQFARGLKAIQAGGGDISQALPILGSRMGLDPETLQAVQQEIAINPNALDGLIAATTDPQRAGSPSGAVQNFEAYQRILATQGPEAAKQFLSLAQPSSGITPYQGAQLGLEAKKIALDEEKLRNPPMSAAERNNIRKLQVSMPKLSSSFRGATRDIDRQIEDARKLRDHPGLAGITGAIQGRIPLSILPQSNAAQALLDTLQARGTFAELQKMRNNSPTGGALGNVSDAEGRRLQAAMGALSQAQTKKDFQTALDNYVAELEFSKNNISEAYQESEELISRLTNERPSTATPRTNVKPKGATIKPAPKVGTVQQGYRFKGGNPGDPGSWEKVR